MGLLRESIRCIFYEGRFKTIYDHHSFVSTYKDNERLIGTFKRFETTLSEGGSMGLLTKSHIRKSAEQCVDSDQRYKQGIMGELELLEVHNLLS